MLKTLMSILGIYKIYEKWLWYQVKNGERPDHIALILDGNRRWAQKKMLEPWIGHQYGAKKTESLLKWCLELGVESVTLYAFSTENFQRPKKEIDEIFLIAEKRLQDVLTQEFIHEYSVNVRVIGRLDYLPDGLRKTIRELEEITKDYNQYFLNIAIAYGGREEIVDAARLIAEKVEKGLLSPQEIDKSIVEQHLYTAHMPNQDPDLIIRTSGEERLSGFLLWQSAYSELCFLEVYWPEFRQIDLLRAVRTYQKRKRRYGQ